ncbi:MAG TPA: nucleotide exchange factor GrpE [Blastocatellia bacterium]|nr:nucleotide exchange factor GrpE [Blastocatellia bacterium]
MEAAELRAENDRLRSENERIRNEWSREHEMHIRALADFDNYRRRIDRERDSVARQENLGLMRSLLDVVDDLECALKDENYRPETVSDHLRATYHRLLVVLEEQGAVPFESLGQPFDSVRHEAVEVLESDMEPGTILNEMRRGWRRGRDLLRPARVIVAR